jgi:outer membrane protein assembly factor BamB
VTAARGGESTAYVTIEEGDLFAFGPDGTVRWTFDPPGTGTVFPARVDDAVLVGGPDDTVHELDAATGSQRWRFEPDAPVRHAPSATDDTVFVGTEEGTLYALDRKQ